MPVHPLRVPPSEQWHTGLPMSQRTVERVVGRLITDEEFRVQFTRLPQRTLAALIEQGWELTAVEIEALIETDTRMWSDGARRIDPRLQRSSLKAAMNPNRLPDDH
jgi:hypothetical protein